MNDNEKLNTVWDRVSSPPKGLRPGFFESEKEKHRIHFVSAPFTNTGVESKGMVVMTHGYLEYSTLYYETIKRYQNLGYDVLMMDFFGFGQSGRPYPDKPKVPSRKGLTEHVDDLDDFINKIVKQHDFYDANKPLFMSTNSMGGKVGLIHMAENPNVFTGAILGSPLTHVNYINLPKKFRPLAQASVYFLNKIGLQDRPIAPSWEKLREGILKKKKVDPYGLRDQLIGDIHRENKEMHVGVPTWGWLQSTFSTSAQVMDPAFLSKVKTPVLWGTGGQDDFIDLTSHYEAVGYIDDVEHVFFPNGCLLYTSPSPRDGLLSRMPSSA